MGRSKSKKNGEKRYFLASFLSRSIGYLERKFFSALSLSISNTTSIFFGELRFSGSHKVLGTYAEAEVFSHDHLQTRRAEFHLFKERHRIVLRDTFLDSKSGILFDSEKSLITESSSWPVESLLLNAIPKPLAPYRSLQNETGFIHLPTTGFYHWLVEDLPPFLNLYHENPNSPLLAFYQLPRYVESILNLFDREIIYVPQFVKTNKLLTVSRNNDVGWPVKEDIEHVKGFFRDFISENIATEKIYISRIGARRSPVFEKELIQILLAQGWKVLDSNLVSFPEQISMISKANIICGVGGAGLSGQIWMHAGSKVIELAPRRYIAANSRLASRLSHEYICINYEEGPFDVREIANSIERLSNI